MIQNHIRLSNRLLATTLVIQIRRKQFSVNVHLLYELFYQFSDCKVLLSSFMHNLWNIEFYIPYSYKLRFKKWF